MKFAAFVNIQCREDQDYNTVYRSRVDEAELADRLGFDALFLAEHAFCRHGRPSPAVTLANMAARTRRIRLGTAVSVLPWHNPLGGGAGLRHAGHPVRGAGSSSASAAGPSRGSSTATASIGWNRSRATRNASRSYSRRGPASRSAMPAGYYEISEVAVNPTPVQRPHPPLWTPTLHAGSMRAAVARGITPMVGASFSHPDKIRDNFPAARRDHRGNRARRHPPRRPSPHLHRRQRRRGARGGARERRVAARGFRRHVDPAGRRDLSRAVRGSRSSSPPTSTR